MNWDLDRLYRGFSDPSFARDLRSVTDEIADARSVLGTMEDTSGAWADVINRMISVFQCFNKVYGMVFLTLAADAENDAALGHYDEIMRIQTELTQLVSAAANRLGGVSDTGALAGADPLLAEHAYVLSTLKKQAAHTMDAAIEPHILKMRMTGSRAFSQLRDMLDSTLLIEVEKGGKNESLPLSAVRGMAYDADAAVRRRAYEAEIAAYPRVEVGMAAALSAVKGEAIAMAEYKRFDSVLDWSLHEARMERGTLETMLDAMRASLPAFRKYFRAKAKMLGHSNGLPFYDLFAPLGTSTRTYTLEEARTLLQTVLGDFSGDMADFVGRAFDERWIDAYPRAGKQGGAFCASVHPLGISYILSNFDGSLSSVLTLAHELGHAYHSDRLMAETILNAEYPMPLAETASIFNETLMSERMLETASGDERRMLLDQSLTDAAQVVVDILSRYIFETEALKLRAHRVPLAKDYKQIMLDAQRDTYGDGLDPEYMHPYMWACKGHYYDPDLHFYNYPYAFGLLFGKGVFAQYRAKGSSFVQEYDGLLTATAKGDVENVAATAHINVRDAAFWRASLDEICRMIDAFTDMA